MNERMPDIDEMIKDCESKLKDDEVIVFGLGAGRIVPMLGKKKVMEKTFKYIRKMKGFIGIHPVDLWHTLLLFDTLNDAKSARNDLKSKGVSVGNVVPVMCKKEHIDYAKEHGQELKYGM